LWLLANFCTVDIISPSPQPHQHLQHLYDRGPASSNDYSVKRHGLGV
jgi:hypothetical protein